MPAIAVVDDDVSGRGLLELVHLRIFSDNFVQLHQILLILSQLAELLQREVLLVREHLARGRVVAELHGGDVCLTLFEGQFEGRVLFECGQSRVETLKVGEWLAATVALFLSTARICLILLLLLHL